MSGLRLSLATDGAHLSRWKDGKVAFRRRRTSCFSKKVDVEDLDGNVHVIRVEEGDTILEAALDAGIDVPHDCKMGVCMTCPSRLVAVVQEGSLLRVVARREDLGADTEREPSSRRVQVHGEVDQSAGMLSEDVIDQGYALLCVSTPKTDCKVKIIEEEELLNVQLVAGEM